MNILLNSLLNTGLTSIGISGYNALDEGAVADGVTHSASAINLAVNNPNEPVVNVGNDATKTFALDQPIIITEDNKTINFYSNLKVNDGTLQYLTADVAVNDTTIQVANASTHFKVGDWITISDDDRGIQGGANPSQVRGAGEGTYITDITGDTITVFYSLDKVRTVAKNALVTKTHSAILIRSNNVTINFYNGVEVDVNGINQHYELHIPNVSGDPTGSEAVMHGCGITTDYGVIQTGITVNNPIVRNSIIHNVCFWKVEDSVVHNLKSYNTHDKSFLFYACKRIHLTGITYIYGAMYEDGLSMYAGNQDITVDYCEAYNCPRTALLIKDGSIRITITELRSYSCGVSRIADYGEYTFGTFYIDGGGLEIYPNGGFMTDIHFDNLEIKNCTRALHLKTDVRNVSIGTLIIDNVTTAVQTWAASPLDITVGGSISNVTGDVFDVIGASVVSANNMTFTNFTSSGVTNTVSPATLTLTNCTGIANGTYT